METLPLHPEVVHLPLALALLVPPLAVLLLWAMRSGRVPAAAWLLVVGLQAVLVGAALVGLQTGEREEDWVERATDQARLESHRRAAGQFTAVSGLALTLAGAAFLAGRARPRAAAAARVATVLVGLWGAGLGLRTGHLGTELVYGPADELSPEAEADEEDPPDEEETPGEESAIAHCDSDRSDDDDDDERDEVDEDDDGD